MPGCGSSPVLGSRPRHAQQGSGRTAEPGPRSRGRGRGLHGSHVDRYEAERRAEKKAPATVNRALAALRRAFKLAVEQERLITEPTIKLFQEDNTRQGFVTPADFETLLSNLPDNLHDFARFAFMTGWRKGELQTLHWSDVDRDGGTVTLR